MTFEIVGDFKPRVTDVGLIFSETGTLSDELTIWTLGVLTTESVFNGSVSLLQPTITISRPMINDNFPTDSDLINFKTIR